jgi:protein-serine/threonine kinase
VISSTAEDGNCNSITLAHALGQGSFSSVWLGRDDSASLDKVIMSRKASIKKQQINGEGSVRRKSSRRSRSSTEETNTQKNTDMRSDRTGDSFSNGQNTAYEASAEGSRLVAVKLTERALCDMNDRTRVSFIREVEVLKVRPFLLLSWIIIAQLLS